MNNNQRTAAPRPTFIFHGIDARTNRERTITTTPSAWLIAQAGGGALAGARLGLRITPDTMAFIEREVITVSE